MKLLKNKIFIVIGILILFILVFLLGSYFYLKSSLKINGNSTITISYNDEYKDKGATLKLFGKDFSKKIKTNGSVKSGVIGSYKISYKAKILFIDIKKERIVNVVDNVSPVITLNGENKVNICPTKKYEEAGYKAFDEYDGDLTDKVIVTNEENIISYEVSDTKGNKEKVIREVYYIDDEAPTLVLNGSQTVYVRNGGQYRELGYTATDNCDEDISVEVNGNVNTHVDGTYTLTYTAKDSSGNQVNLNRNVVVYTDNRVGIVYLTFDDGPSSTGSTEKILNILKSEGVKATFFVTGKGPDWLIKREYDEGHVVALHTNTHEYNRVYSSVDAYYSDLNAVRNRVYNITGKYSNIIRFPGGSNNTVSNRYNQGIMNILTKDVVQKGYYYFDWNISSGDAGICTTSSCVYNNVVNNLSKNRINIVLMHDIKMFTANALQDIIIYCKENGYRFDVITESTQPVRFK